MAEVVGFEPTDPFEPSVFKTAALSQTQPHFLKLGTPCLIRTDSQLLLRESALPISVTGHLERDRRIELLTKPWQGFV